MKLRRREQQPLGDKKLDTACQGRQMPSKLKRKRKASGKKNVSVGIMGDKQKLVPKKEKDCKDSNFNADENESSSQSSASSDISLTTRMLTVEKKPYLRLGPAYQARVPNLLQRDNPAFQAESGNSLLIWKPADTFQEKETDEFVTFARNEHGYTEEQALGILCYNGFDLEKSKQEVPKHRPEPPAELNEEEKMLFQNGILTHGPDFQELAKLIRHKSVASLIHDYYQWKMEKAKKSRMDVPDKRAIPKRSNPNRCKNCKIRCEPGTTQNNLCQVCHSYWEKTGAMAPSTKALPVETRGVPPSLSHMNLNLDDLKVLMTYPEKFKVIVKELDKKIVDLKMTSRKEKQEVELGRRKLPEEGAMSRFRVLNVEQY